MNTRALRAAAVLAAALTLLTGFGSTLAAAAPVPPQRPMVGGPAPAPSDKELNEVVNAAAAGRTEIYESGGVLTNAGTRGQVQSVIANANNLGWRKSIQPGSIKVNGYTATATLASSVPPHSGTANDTFYIPMSFIYIDGRWKLSQAGQCSIAKSAFVPANC